MKTKLFILSFLVLAFSTLKAHVITVSNAPVSAGHFYNLQIAIDSANVGDTVYCMGSPNAYNSYGESTYGDNNIHITTRITLIGAGYNVTGTQNNWISYVSGSIILDSNAFTVQLSGTKILGIDCRPVYQNGSGSINNVDMERCYIPSWVYVFGHGWTIYDNNIYGVIIQYNAYTYIENNFLYQVENSNQTTVVISNNDFVVSGGNAWSTVSNALVANNVFFYDNPTLYATSCVFTNNIAFNGSAITLPPAGNTGSGNSTPASLGVFGFTDATLTGYVNQNQVWSHVWTFKASSPAYHGGTDGTDMGVNGGAYPYPNYSGATRIPQMTLLNVPAIVPQGGSMNVNFKARDQK